MSLLDPIDHDKQCGEDYKYDDQYLEIEVEIEKSFNPASESHAQWEIIIDKCEEILETRSKDLKIASYWLYAQWEQNGWGALLDSFEVYVSLISRFGSSLYPLAGRRKIKILEWVQKVLDEPLLKEVERFSETQLLQVSKILIDLGQVVPVCVEEEYICFKELQTKCNRLIEQTKYREEEALRQEELNKQEDARRKEEQASMKEIQQLRRSEEEEILSKFIPSSSQRPAAVSHMDSYNTLTHDDIDETIEPMLEIAKIMFKKAPTDYYGYKVLFSLGEMLLEEALSDDDVISDDFIPSEDICNVVRQLAEAGTVSIKQLEALYEQLTIRPTWLEGYYVASRVLYKLGQTEEAQQLEELILHFLHRKEALLHMGIGERVLVEGKMLLWANTKLLLLSDSAGSSAEYQRVYQEILAVKKEQSTQNALEMLEEHYQKAVGDEERFRWRLLFVDFALEAGDKQLALSLSLELERQIEYYQIDKWQPELAIVTYETLLKPIMTQELGAEGKERIYNKLSILDVQKVINL